MQYFEFAKVLFYTELIAIEVRIFSRISLLNNLLNIIFPAQKANFSFKPIKISNEL
jgi:hypothetical protein